MGPSSFSDSVLDNETQDSEEDVGFPCLHTTSEALQPIPEDSNEQNEDADNRGAEEQEFDWFGNTGYYHGNNGILGCFTTDPLPNIGETLIYR